MDQVITDLIILRVKVTRDGKEKNSAPSLGSQFLLRPCRSAVLPRTL